MATNISNGTYDTHNKISYEIALNTDNTLNSENPTTYVVDGRSENQMENNTIQATIDKAKSGDTIIITGTNYVHCHFIVNKQLNIISNSSTTMSTCPSNIEGSESVGIFYINYGGSGTLISGFNLINEADKKGSADPYCIYINGAENVIVNKCAVETINGPGIHVNNASNIFINNTYVSNSKKGIYVNISKNINIKASIIKKNNIAGIYFGNDVNNTTVYNNTINSNNYYGIYYGSCIYTSVISNKITDNRNDEIFARATEGVGIYVNNNITKMIIKGNYFFENGEYGIFNSYVVDNLDDQYVQIIDNNFFC